MVRPGARRFNALMISNFFALLGYKSIDTTLRHSYLSPNHKKRVVDILDKRIDTFWVSSVESSMCAVVEVEKEIGM